MDPNATLDRIRELLSDYRDGDPDAENPEKLSALLDALAENVASLDGWMTSGGFLPEKWAVVSRPSVRVSWQVPPTSDIENIIYDHTVDAGEAGLAIVDSDVEALARAIADVQKVNTRTDAAVGECEAMVQVAGERFRCERDAPHEGWTHEAVDDGGAPIYWCSDAEAQAVTVE